ncbi:response regulator [Sandaracinus amylolyticus]|uniref:histidine kinase n=1 Tax=Sandaracinus amylolyticus TaxID=927083 RepID=A0A0F6YG01_9BACT|nr:response regulator [Sandaracinus amylolyticus]AKF03072.1 Sensory box sensor histidine kinase/response regulator [Sandaracinus amylolyticus]
MQLHSIFDASPNAYMVLDRELRFVAANEAYLRVTASRLEDLIGRVIFEVFPHDPEDPDNDNARLLRASLERTLRSKRRDHLALIRYRVPRETPNGVVVAERFWSATHTPILDERGEVAYVLQHTSDVTELERLRAAARDATGERQHQLEADVLARASAVQDTNSALEAERRRMQQLFRQAPGFMCVLGGPDHVFELANQAYLELVGARDVIGRPVREALPEVAEQGFIELLDRVRKSGEPFVGRAIPVALERGGHVETRYLDFVYQPVIEADGTTSGLFVQGHDVTEERRARDEVARYRDHLEDLVAERTRALEQSESALRHAQKMEAVGSLTGGVAHDFNNLLQVIAGNLALIAPDVAGDPQATRRLREATSAVERGAKLSSQLLAFARRQELDPEVVELDRLTRDVEPLLRRAVGEQIEIARDVEPGLWRTFVDRNQLDNVLLNLAINARDAMNGAGRLVIAARNVTLDAERAARHPEATAGDHVLLSVSDTGCGMTREVIERAFEPFFTTKGEGRGTGLGLSMVYGFVRQTGGHVAITSEPGRGTTIEVYLPRTHRVADADTEATAAGARGGSETILVLEDDVAVRATVVDLLRDLGYRVIEADSGASAMAILESGAAIDLLFVDVVVPGALRSHEIAARAEAARPELAVLFTSGYSEDAVAHEALLGRRARLLRKPYSRDELARRVREVLDARARSCDAAVSSMRVLIVEDDDDSRELAGEMLSALGHDVQIAASGAQAREALQRARFDVLFTDVGLPDVSGVELARGAMRDDAHMGVVLASGYGESARSADDTELARAVVLEKPYLPAQLESALRAAARPRS